MSYKVFRHKQAANEDCNAKIESSFILEGTSSVIIHVLRLNVNKRAALIINDKEGPDSTIVFTYKEPNPIDELLQGDYFTWDGGTYLVYEDVKLVRDVLYKKQKSYECNVSFAHGEDTIYGYFVSSLAKYVDTTLQSKLNITDNEKPILIIPYADWIETGYKLILNGKPYKIIDFDAITNEGIVYCSLDRDFIQKHEDVAAEPESTDTLTAGIENTIATEYGYFKTDADVEVIKKTLKEVKFKIPYGIDTITITTKNADKTNITNIYKVVI